MACGRRCRPRTTRAAGWSGWIGGRVRCRCSTPRTATGWACGGRTIWSSIARAASGSPISASGGTRDLDYGGVYYAAADGSAIIEAAHPFLTANGIGLSPDESVLYVAETEGGRLWAFDLEAPGRIRKQPWPSPHGGRLVYTAGNSYERFDSLAVEDSGNICVATLINGGISVISPAGELVEFVPMPDRYTTNICFGGADHEDSLHHAIAERPAGGDGLAAGGVAAERPGRLSVSCLPCRARAVRRTSHLGWRCRPPRPCRRGWSRPV